MTFLQNVMFGGVVSALRLLFLTVHCGPESCELRNIRGGSGGSDVIVAHARHIISLHVKMCGAVDMVNSAYHLQVVARVLTSSIALTFVTYSASL
ncbi:hypothetical protein PR048_019757 [Dryococelus australis]|uniref:Secreted protein n=1 Tax=Dryococelus australis TaxID=614101 RepID=A0ABQ9H4C9_9NEOP|nr:hypothetical protein PR048_019757 [Dryococelus australis]